MASTASRLGGTEQLLFGMRLPDLLSLIWQARREIPRRSYPKVLRQVLQSALIEAIFQEEERQLGELISAQRPSSPLIILGVPRTGTTRLHYLLWQDQRLAPPSLLEVFNPHTFFFLSHRLSGLRFKLLQTLFKYWTQPPAEREWRRHSDAIVEGLNLPFEDELAMHMMNQASTVSWLFPSLAGKYAKYLTLRELGTAERERWKRDWYRFLQKLTLSSGGKRLLLKAPAHTGKVKTILEVFPEAKFIHIHRDPYQVYASFKHWQQRYPLPEGFGQNPTRAESLNLFQLHHDLLISPYFQDRELIPQGQLYEMSYGELTKEPTAELEKAYQAFGLDFSGCRESVQKYVDETRDYTTNQHPELEPGEKLAIFERWRDYFEEYGYQE